MLTEVVLASSRFEHEVIFKSNALLGLFWWFSGKELLPMQEMPVLSLDQENPLEKEIATHSSILAWKIPWTGGAWLAIVHGAKEELDMT